MRLGEVTVAIDHSPATISRYLGAAKGGVSVEELRGRLIRSILKSGCDAALVPPDYIHKVSSQWPSQVIMGFPDLWPVDFVKNLNRFREIALKHRKYPIKIGIHIDQIESQILTKFVEELRTLSSNVIFEPYFSTSMSVKDRLSVLNLLSNVDIIFAFKLDIASAQGTADAYTTACHPKPWLARSDGMTFDAFLTEFKVAIGFGCQGAIVGAAIWSSELAALSKSDQAHEVDAIISNRVSILRDSLISAQIRP